MEYSIDHRSATLNAAAHIMDQGTETIAEKITIAISVLCIEDQQHVAAFISKAIQDLKLKAK
jgi:hypothetical protein